MKYVFIVSYFFFPSSAFSVASESRDTAMWNLCGMSECYLSYSGIAFIDYGCYCGFGGSGIPVNEIDT
ncbi:unnamed protein product [Thelazia callipaeda]|uniref:PA2c domain-containing protein n=1 Tax=Thelazia callipaeda TaxID=103827 RepID=A0A0N5CT18_THECL|nr:unnamed protein product [Thelazia callipaeda]